MTGTAARRLPGILLGVLVVAGCSTLPVSGPVHTQADNDTNSVNQAPYFAPPGPTSGADTTSIVNGFLLAIQANPPSTAVARSFLSDSAKATWKPIQGTIVYDAPTLTAVGERVDARLAGSHRLDQRGGWLGGSVGSAITLPFTLVQEHGEWRIVNPPSSLPVPTSYFRSLYVPYTLYFFDRTGTVLVPTRIYLPRGEQIASNLVRGLLAGPGTERTGSTQSAFPPGTALDSGVVTNEDGLAEVPLGPEVQRLSPPDLHRLIVQLAWTLRQVPGITRLRITADGVAVALPDGQTDVSLTERLEYDPVSAPARDVVGLSAGRVVLVDRQGTTPVGGPLGQPGFSLRSVAHSGVRHEFAAVAGNGAQAYLASDRGAAAAGVSTVLSGAENLLRPVYDRFGGLWLVDAARSGAVVHLVSGGQARVVRVPGVTGRRISSFTVTRDGGRLVAGLVSSSSTSVAVADVVRAGRGRVVRLLGAGRIAVPGSDLGSVIDVAQDGPTTVAVLTRSVSGTRHVLSVEVDGSPGDRIGTPAPVPDQLVTLVVSPDPNLPQRAVSTDGRLLELNGSGQWVRVASDILTASYTE